MIAGYVRADAKAAADAFADPDSAPEAAIVYPESSSDASWLRAKGRGKGKGSRWNAVRHGCMAQMLIPADLQVEVDQCTAMLTEEYRPTTAFEGSAIARMGRLRAQLERLEKMIVIDLQRTMDRARLVWHDDRDVYIDQLVERLAVDSGVGRALTRSRQGVDWLLKTWKCLEEVVAYAGEWTQDQFRLAMDMLSIRPELRDGYYKMLVEGDDFTEIMTQEIAQLEENLKHSLVALDHAEQSLAAAGMPMEEDKDTKRLRKQISKVKLDYRRAKAELDDSRAAAAAAAAGPPPGPPPTPPPPPPQAPEPVASSIRTEPDADPDPPPRPKTSNAAFNFLQKRSLQDAFEIPATATAPAKYVSTSFPFPGGDPEPEPAAESEPESERDSEAEAQAVVEAVSVAEPAAVRPRPAGVETNASRAAAANQRREQERRKRLAQEKKARKAARRNRR